MIALDTNILLALHRAETPTYAAAMAAYEAAGGDAGAWALPWPCIHEFIAVATHPRIFDPPTPLDVVLEAVQSWRERPRARFLAEDDAYWPVLAELARTGGISGARIHDTRVAALCLHHGVRELWTADRDFSRFPRLRTRNPLVAAPQNT